MDSGSNEDKKAQSIVQCPECQTKFGVSSDILKQQDAPRFHCSRCDHVFELSPEHLFKSDPDQATETNMRATPPPPTKSLNIPKEFKPDTSISAPHESAPERPKAGQESNLLSRLSFVDLEKDQISMDFPAKPAKDSAYQTRTKMMPPRDSRVFSLGAKADAALAGAQQITIPEILQRPNYWRNFFCVAGPLLVFLVLLAASGLYLQANTKAATQLISGYFPHLPQAAPPGLHIKDSRFRSVILDSGEKVHVVSGTMVNDTDRRFRDIELEAFVFDKQGRVLDRTRVNAGSTLAKTKIKSLTTEMIRGLQSGRVVKNFELLPGQEQEFAVALSGNTAPPSFFSARIHTVR